MLMNIVFITNYTTYNIYHNFNKLKNEFFFFCNSFESNNILLNLYNTYIVDLFCMDNSYVKYLNIYNKNVFYIKYYVYSLDIFINLFSSTFNKLPVANNVYFLARECLEFFNIKFYNLYDTRNLLCDYSNRGSFLLKSVQLDNYSSIKNNSINIESINKSSILL